jgi:broad specificity phosphatase PhoE
MVYFLGKDGDSMNYYLVRHGQTPANRKGIIQGHLNVPLSDRGLLQAKLVGEALAKVKIDAVYSSDLDRAKDTAMEIAKHHNCKLVFDRRLREVHCGSMQGKTMAQCRELFPEFFEARKSNPYLVPRPGGGECDRDLYERVMRAFFDIQRECPGSDVSIVTHGGPIRCLLSYVLKGEFDPGLSTVANTSVSAISNRGGKWEVVKSNEVAHLEPIGDHRVSTSNDFYRW